MNRFFHAESHLNRAAALLAENRLEALFYAALEFRYAVESRLLEYSEHAEEFAKNRRSKWRRKDIAKHVDSVFTTRGAVYTVEIFLPKSPKSIVIRYTPVTKEILKIVGQTDNFLHANGLIRCREQSQQKKLKRLLQEGIRQMKDSISGGLQGPLLRGPDGLVRMVINADAHPELQELISKGDAVTMRIDISPFIDEKTTAEQIATDNLGFRLSEC